MSSASPPVFKYFKGCTMMFRRHSNSKKITKKELWTYSNCGHFKNVLKTVHFQCPAHTCSCRLLTQKTLDIVLGFFPPSFQVFFSSDGRKCPRNSLPAGIQTSSPLLWSTHNTKLQIGLPRHVAYMLFVFSLKNQHCQGCHGILHVNKMRKRKQPVWRKRRLPVDMR